MEEKTDNLSTVVSKLTTSGKLTKFISILQKKYEIDDKIIKSISSELLSKSGTLSFCLLDDCRFDEDDTIHKSFNNEKELKEILNGIWKKYSNAATFRYFFSKYSVGEILKELLEDGYYVFNRFEKYYVIAFSINYKRFWVWSKDCEAEIIKWREDDMYDDIANNLDSEYDVNPVIKIVSELNKRD